jgi:hypothetical protein
MLSYLFLEAVIEIGMGNHECLVCKRFSRFFVHFSRLEFANNSIFAKFTARKHPLGAAMQLPKYKKKKRIKLKVCQEPGCGREFWGHPIAKYCELHRDIKQRQKQKKDIENIEAKNIIFRHDYTEVMDLPFKCCLEGCDDIFEIKVFPKQFVYPRFCVEHRNDFKRTNFLRIMRRKNREE